MSDATEGTELDHLTMIHAEFVDRAMRSREPVTEIREVGSERRVYSAAYYDPSGECCWRADIDHDPAWDSGPSVTFAKCWPTAEHESVQDWSPLATGRLSGPQKLPAWRALFEVFEAVVEFFDEEYYG